MILPKEQAFDFLLFAQRNPKPCPLLEVMEPGVTALVTAPGADIRTDVPFVPRVEAWRLVAKCPIFAEYWAIRFGHVCDWLQFHIRVSADGGGRAGAAHHGRPQRADVRHVDRVPFAGAFHSTMVVSMRGIPSTQVADACRISGYYPSVHGAPVCVGDPSAIGIDDIMHPDYGDAPVLEPGDVPVFWRAA